MTLWIIPASDGVTNPMTLEYETVHYSRGPVNNGTPKGFPNRTL